MGGLPTGIGALSELAEGDIVRREKAWILSGCDSRPATLIVPAGSNRSGGGGDDTVGAFDVKDRLAVPRVGRPQRK